MQQVSSCWVALLGSQEYLAAICSNSVPQLFSSWSSTAIGLDKISLPESYCVEVQFYLASLASSVSFLTVWLGFETDSDWSFSLKSDPKSRIEVNLYLKLVLTTAWLFKGSLKLKRKWNFKVEGRNWIWMRRCMRIPTEASNSRLNLDPNLKLEALSEYLLLHDADFTAQDFLFNREESNLSPGFFLSLYSRLGLVATPGGTGKCRLYSVVAYMFVWEVMQIGGFRAKPKHRVLKPKPYYEMFHLRLATPSKYLSKP